MPETKPFYYFAPTKYALEGVKNHRLKAAELDKANDPYELLPVRCNNEIEDTLCKQLKQSISDGFKMICLSETYKNPSLWGHYADNCMGVCLGFDVEVHEDKDRRRITKMEYIKDKRDVSKFGFNFVNGELSLARNKKNKIHNYKSHYWKHEEEWRIWEFETNLKLDPISGLYFFPFGDLLKLREILIGFRCKDENIKRRFEKAAEGYPEPPEISYTRPSFSTFEIEKVP